MNQWKDLWQGMEDFWRRELVAFRKAAGTLIRKEELRRQALTAQINLPRAERNRDAIALLMEKTFPLDKISERMSELAKGSPPPAERIGSVVTELLRDTLWRFGITLPSIGFSGEQIVYTIQELNAIVEQVVNKIISDISKEGVYYTPLTTISISATLPENVRKLPNVYHIAVHVVEFLRTIMEVERKREYLMVFKNST